MNDFIELLEANISTLSPMTISKAKMRVDRPTVFITIPDTNVKLYSSIQSSGLLLSNCTGIVSPNKMVSVHNKKFNGKLQYNETKKDAIHSKSGKKLTVMATVPIEGIRTDGKKKKNFLFYDMSIYSKGLSYMLTKFPEKITARNFFENISNTYQLLKKSNVATSHELLFLIQNEKGSLYNILKNLKTLIPLKDFETMNIFDNFTLISNTNGVIIPIVRKDNLKNKLIISNIQRIPNYFKVEEVKTSAISGTSGTSETPADTLSKPTKNSVLTKMAKNFREANLKTTIDEEGKIVAGIDKNQLSAVLKKYKIDDPDVIANVKGALDNFIQLKGDKLTQDEAAITVLKAINYMIHDKEEIDEEYLAKPEKLISKLSEQRTHKTPLSFPKLENTLIGPDQVVDIKHTTGAWRQKQEFETTIHTNVKKLFKSIETTSTRPIKVKNIKWKIIEDDPIWKNSRLIHYEITLQNATGGHKEPYVVNLKVPAPVNDRYFKIQGSNYIMATQQFLKPVTKTDKNEVRILSNYSIIRVGLENLKFNPADIEEVINYIHIRYPNLMKESTDSTVTFKDGSMIFLSGNKVYESTERKISIDEDSGKLTDDKGIEINVKKNEFIYEILMNEILTVNPEDKLTRTKKTIPYINMYLGGLKIPMILYLWQLKGLLTTLNDLGIDYEITNQVKPADVAVKMEDGKALLIRPKSLREKLITNGLLVSRFKKVFKNLDDPAEIHPLISQTYGSGSIFQMRLQTQNCIDPVTKEMLQYESLPETLPNLVSTHCIDLLLNKKMDSLSNLKIYRARLSEVMLNLMYKQIKMAQNHYITKVDEYGDENAKLAIDPDYILRDIITEAGVLQFAEPTSPVDEIALASRTIKTGPGGLPGLRSAKPAHRNIDPSQYGIMSAVATPEAGNVGLIVSHTLTPVMMNELGSYGNKDLSTISKFGTLSINEALTPFQNEVDSDRLIMACAHHRQVTPTNGRQAPLVRSGAEYIVPQISSARFAQRSKKDGTVTEVVPGKTMTVEYKDGTAETFDILPRLSKTKMGVYILIEMTPVEKGTMVKKDQVIAASKNFDENGIYCSGRNVFMAVMNYGGFSHEDSYVISESLAENMSRDIVKEVHIVVPPDTKIMKLEKKVGKNVTKDTVLVEFTYDQDLDEYLELNNLNQSDEEEYISTFAKNAESITLLAQEGEIANIKVFINNKNSVDPQIVKFHKELVNDTKKTISKLSKNAETPEAKQKSVDNLDLNFIKTGGHKFKGTEFLGARIVYYIRQTKPLQEGDKMATRYGAKGVLGKIISKADIPTTVETKKEVEMFISPIGVFSRKNTAMIKELYLGKIMYFLNEKLRDMANDTTVKTEDIFSFLMDIMGLISTKEVLEKIEQNISKIKPTTFRRLIKEEKFQAFATVPPFTDIKFEDIKTAADQLEIPLDEKVYIPELGTTTKEPVPVGISYGQALEQTSEIYSNVRSTGRYDPLTRQATKGKAREGGQSFGKTLPLYTVMCIEQSL